MIDTGETDPNDPADDAERTTDMDCGDGMSGSICLDGACTPGCRTDGNGNGCPDGQVCVSQNDGPGMCQELERYAGGGCSCRVDAHEAHDELGPLTSLALIALAMLIAGRGRRHS